MDAHDRPVVDRSSEATELHRAAVVRVAGARVARLASVDSEGWPHVVPCCFALDGDTLYSAVDDKPKRSLALRRLANVETHPQVELVVDHYADDWTQLWWVRVRGRARIVSDGPERRRALDLLAAKYSQYDQHPPPGPVLAVDVVRWRSWQANAVRGDPALG